MVLGLRNTGFPFYMRKEHHSSNLQKLTPLSIMMPYKSPFYPEVFLSCEDLAFRIKF